MARPEALDPEVVAILDAIDHALDGQPVDPELADVAELSLILRAERPQADPAFLATLDRRAEQRFATGSETPRARRGHRSRSRARRWRPGWLASAAGAVATVIVGIVLVGGAVHQTVHDSSSGQAGHSSSAAGVSGAAAGGGSGAASAGGSSRAAPRTSTGATAPPAVGRSAPVPRGGHDLALSAQLTLRARAGRLDAVAQQVFDVVAREHGSVTSSRITSLAAGPSSGRVALRVPSTRLQATLDRLSSLHGASVVARSDAAQDVAPQIDGAAARLAVARAARRSLLRQLGAATTGTEADHLQAQLRRNASAIAGDEEALARLRGRVSESTVAVTLSAPAPRRVAHHHRAGGFSLGSGLHDAGHILLVAAGVLVIALAVLVPLLLVVAGAAWVWSYVTRRRREATLGP